MPRVPAYVATSPTAPLSLGTVERRDVGPRDVRIDIAWSGICHSDIHTVRGDWGPVPYPLTVGHEIVGVVAEVGDDVTRHRVGDRVGVGCMVDSCRSCDPCRAGLEQYCLAGKVDTYNGRDGDGAVTQGGYASGIVVDEHFVLRIPEGLPSASAAPLLCAGITTWSPLRRWGAGPGRRVAVLGMGGLGHMAVKLAKALGAEVTVLSQTTDKRDDARRFGADHFHATSDPATLPALAGRFDLVLNTVSAPVDVDAYLALLSLDGTLVYVGAPAQPVAMSVFTLFDARRTVAGSTIGGIRETQELLDFCAEHGIVPEVEFINGDQIDAAWERVLRSQVRYRYVIDMTSVPDTGTGAVTAGPAPRR